METTVFFGVITILLLLLLFIFQFFNRSRAPDLKADMTEFREDLIKEFQTEFQTFRQETMHGFSQQRQELNGMLLNMSQHQRDDLARQDSRLQAFQELVEKLLREILQKQFQASQDLQTELIRQITEQRNNLDKAFKETREEISQRLKEIREESARNLHSFGDSQTLNFSRVHQLQEESRRESMEKLEKIREVVQSRLEEIRKSNEDKLEQMRRTVDEKLHETLEKRLSESFTQVSKSLEQVHKDLGEMQTLAAGVGDLKKVLSNVKTRGILGEVQLGNIFENILNPEQYSSNVKVNPESNELVEFAVKLPGRSDDGSIVWLPADSKFPLESYQRLMTAQEEGNLENIKAARKEFEAQLLSNARKISEKYIFPPHTTDFAIMFLPTESLYAEALHSIDLVAAIQRDFKVIITGPTTLAAVLNSLQMGFRTLAIERRSAEVWKVLGAVKTEFGKFRETLIQAKKKVESAGKSLDELIQTRSNQMDRKLREVEELPREESEKVLRTTVTLSPDLLSSANESDELSFSQLHESE